MREQVLHFIHERQLVRPGDRVAVAVSGGADSVALLRVLLELRAELGIVLVVAHFNHQLRGDESDADEQFVAALAQRYDLPFCAASGDVRSHAAAHKLSLEHAARELRYRWFAQLTGDERLACVATAHTADDQAETVLMKFLRGAGTRGLSGIHPVLVMDSLRVIRPLLQTSRAEVERYLTSLQQPWCDDHTNLDTQHTRNRIRHELLPLLERDYNPAIRQLLGATADIAAEEESAWQAMAESYLLHQQRGPRRLLLESRSAGLPGEFRRESVALQRRILKLFLERHAIAAEFQHVEAVRHCALSGAPANLPGGWRSERDGQWLVLHPAADQPDATIKGYEHPLPLQARVSIPEAAIVLETKVISPEAAALQPPGSLLALDKLLPHLSVRNWLPGDRFRPAHSGSEKKLKELFAARKVPSEQRSSWPVVLSGSHIVWVRGFPVAHDFAWAPGCGDALAIEALPLP